MKISSVLFGMSSYIEIQSASLLWHTPERMFLVFLLSGLDAIPRTSVPNVRAIDRPDIDSKSFFWQSLNPESLYSGLCTNLLPFTAVIHGFEDAWPWLQWIAQEVRSGASGTPCREEVARQWQPVQKISVELPLSCQLVNRRSA